MRHRQFLLFFWGLLVGVSCHAGARDSAGTSACQAQDRTRLQAVAPGVWVWAARNQDIAPSNAGHVGSVTILVAQGQATIIDPGPTHQHGVALRRALRCQLGVTARTIINSHAHAEQVLANSAFLSLLRSGRLHIYASATTQQSMRQRCPSCLQQLTRSLGDQLTRGSTIVLPNRVLDDGQVVSVGQQRWQVRLFTHAHTESDLVLWQPDLGVLIAGGLLYEQRVPELAQGSLVGWLAALTDLAQYPARVTIGHTVSADSGGISATRAYLQALQERVWAALEQGGTPSNVDTLELPAFADWAGYRERHGFNVQRAWRELEPLWMNSSMPGATPAVSASSASNVNGKR